MHFPTLCQGMDCCLDTCFLKWDVDQGAGLFGEAVVEQISRAVGVVDLELYGFLARPLYVCTASSGSKEQMCMSVASMSPLIIHTEARHHYRCRKCAGDVSLEDPASGSLALRVLHI